MRILSLALLLTMSYNLSSQWDRQYPFNHIGIINDIVVNGERGAAVGDDATIFLSSDSGQSWTIKDNDLNDWDFATVERRGNLVYACGKGIYKSVDNGQTFNVLDNTPQQIFDSYLSPSGVLIVCNNEGVYRSEDGGFTFTNLNPPTDSLGISSYIYDENHIWWIVAGQDARLFITRDGGDTWETNTALTRPSKVAFYNENIGIGSALPYLYYTTDGGRTWEERARLSRRFGKMLFGNDPEEIYITSLNNFYTSKDGGMTTTEFKNILPSSDLNGLYISRDDEIFVGASFSTIAQSTDQASNWQDITGKEKVTITAMTSENGQTLYAGGNQLILTSSDGGEDWQVWDTVSIALRAMHVAEDDLIVAGRSAILRKNITTKVEEVLYNPDRGIFEAFYIMESGRYVAYNTADFYATSDDKGMTWDSIYIERFTDGIDKVDNDLFLRMRGKLLRSTDEGDTWEEVYTNLSDPRGLNGLSSVDSTIYIIESTRNLRRSFDYGRTWDSLTTPTGGPIIMNEIFFVNRDTGYLYDQTSQQLWYTFDGGQSWPVSYFPRAGLAGMYSYRSDDVLSIWLHGQGSFIERQSDCANPPLLSNIMGMNFPCLYDTVTYSVGGANIDRYYWSVPDEWVVVGPLDGPEITMYAEEPGVGFLTVFGENGCGTTDALELQVAGTSIPDVELMQFGDLLRTQADGESFAWYKDDVLIPDATDAFYTPTVTGEYTVEVTFSTGCSRRSNSISITISSVVDDHQIATLYPNPISDNLIYLNHNFHKVPSELLIYNSFGRQVNFIAKYQPNSIQLTLPEGLSSGVYQLTIPEWKYHKAFMKIK